MYKYVNPDILFILFIGKILYDLAKKKKKQSQSHKCRVNLGFLLGLCPLRYFSDLYMDNTAIILSFKPTTIIFLSKVQLFILLCTDIKIVRYDSMNHGTHRFIKNAFIMLKIRQFAEQVLNNRNGNEIEIQINYVYYPKFK